MARSESDREDVLREATALVERAELKLAGEAEPVVVGFRRDGAASVFFGADPVYQFNTAGELRRAYVGGLLYKAERGRLVALKRERSAAEVALVRTELTEEAFIAFLAAAEERLARLRAAFDVQTVTLLAQVPPGADIVKRIGEWLAALPTPLRVARLPNVR